MPTALTAYLTSTVDTLVTTADQLTNSAPASQSNVATRVGKSTGWVEMDSQGTTTNLVGPTEPAASGNGWIWDVTTLEDQQIVAGNWTPRLSFQMSTGSITADIVCRVFVRSSGGVYTQIGSDMTKAGQSITTTANTYLFSAASLPAQSFNTGDKLYIDVLLNITANSTNSNTANVLVFRNGGNNESVATPGYQSPFLQSSPLVINQAMNRAANF